MESQYRRIALLVIVVVLVVAAGTSYFLNRFDLPVPSSLAQVKEFTSRYPVSYSGTGQGVGSQEAAAVDTYRMEIETDSSPVTVTTAKYPGADQAGDSFAGYKQNHRGQVNSYLSEINLPWIGSYWSATTGGTTYAGWRRGQWVVFIDGHDRDAVKQVEKRFKSYLQGK